MIFFNINNKKLILSYVLKTLSVGFYRIEAAHLNWPLDPYTSREYLKARISQIYIPLTTSNTLNFSRFSKLARQLFMPSSFFLRNLPLKHKTKVFLASWKWLGAFTHKRDENPALLRASQRKIKREQASEIPTPVKDILKKVRKNIQKRRKEGIEEWINSLAKMNALAEECKKRSSESKIRAEIQHLQKLVSDLEGGEEPFIPPELVPCFQTSLNTFKGLSANLPFDIQLKANNKISEIQKILDLGKLDLRTSYHLMKEAQEAMRMFSESYAQPQKVFFELQNKLSKSQKDLNETLQKNKDLSQQKEMLEKRAVTSDSVIGSFLTRTEQNREQQDILNGLEEYCQHLEEEISVLDDQLQTLAEKGAIQIFTSRGSMEAAMQEEEEIDLLNTPLQAAIAENEAAQNKLEQERQKKLKLKKACEEQIFKLKHPSRRPREQGDEIERKTPPWQVANTPVKEFCEAGVFTANLSTTGASPFLDERLKNSFVVEQQALKKRKRKGFRSFLKSLRATRPTRSSSLQKTTGRPETASDIF